MSECNPVECNFVQLTYYQKNRDVILNRAKIIMKMIRRD